MVTVNYKKVLNFAAQTVMPGTIVTEEIIQGVDGVSPGQGGVVDGTVPTGCQVKGIVIQGGWHESANQANVLHWTIQLLRGSQVNPVHPQLVGGDVQRNQVFKQGCRFIEQSTSNNQNFYFKIPKGFQRIRDGDRWVLSWISDNSLVRVAQYIFKLKY